MPATGVVPRSPGALPGVDPARFPRRPAAPPRRASDAAPTKHRDERAGIRDRGEWAVDVPGRTLISDASQMRAAGRICDASLNERPAGAQGLLLGDRDRPDARFAQINQPVELLAGVGRVLAA